MSTQPISYPASPTLVVPANRIFSWTGIFAGTFLFLAIEVTFGILGAAVFGVAGTSTPANPVGPGISLGPGIWMIVLSIIAFYFGGKLASRLSGAVTRNMGMYAGLIMFGMSLFTVILVGALTLGSSTTGIGYAGPARVVETLIAGGFWLFITLVLGMISAAFGGMHGAWSTSRTVTTTTVDRTTETRRVA